MDLDTILDFLSPPSPQNNVGAGAGQSKKKKVTGKPPAFPTLFGGRGVAERVAAKGNHQKRKLSLLPSG